ncbi:conserved hypothetical protein [Cenarchaeum symbiosum A]|uniref:Uncharacterized protein n=1 Tax=Cenarchaeum symbiosum (strain A) TaxID=414004 RepID=A0RUW4_CENSY|nr:conserved hypothetical protein [Cenarchaeum symbiosum A]
MKGKGAVLAAVAAAVILAAVGYNYHADQLRISGGIFGNELQAIQDDLTAQQDLFSAELASYEGGSSTRAEFLAASEGHFVEMDGILDRYDSLRPPPAFESSVELFRLSTESQIGRDQEVVLWVETGDPSHNLRADELHQESFAYELAALADYKAAQSGAR